MPSKGRRKQVDLDGPRSAAEMRRLARQSAKSAIARLAALSRSEDERVALAATQELLNRAFGKIGAVIDERPAPERKLVVKIVRFGDVDEAVSARGEA